MRFARCGGPSGGCQNQGGLLCVLAMLQVRSPAGFQWPNHQDKAVPISANVVLEDDVVIFHKDLVNLYGCRIGAGTKIGAFVEVQKNATIGRNCKISSHTFVCEGVEIEDEVFVGHGVMFINDRYPRAV